MPTPEEMIIQKLEQLIMAVRSVGSVLKEIDDRNRSPVSTIFEQQRKQREEQREEALLRENKSLTRATWILAVATVGLVLVSLALILVTLKLGLRGV